MSDRSRSGDSGTSGAPERQRDSHDNGNRRPDEAGILEALDGEVPLLIVAGGYAVIVTSQAVITGANKRGHRFTYPEIARVSPMQHTYKRYGVEVISHEALKYSDVSPEYQVHSFVALEMSYEAAQTVVAAIQHHRA